VIKAGIETNPQNYTRFVVVARRQGSHVPTPAGRQEANRASLVFSVKDEPGSLYAALKILADHGLNLSKLESRPILGQPWRYLFYVDVSVPRDRAAFDSGLAALAAQTSDLYTLGVYQAAA